MRLLGILAKNHRTLRSEILDGTLQVLIIVFPGLVSQKAGRVERKSGTIAPKSGHKYLANPTDTGCTHFKTLNFSFFVEIRKIILAPT